MNPLPAGKLAMLLRTSFPVGIGFDIAGVVVKAGAKCTRLKVCRFACLFVCP